MLFSLLAIFLASIITPFFYKKYSKFIGVTLSVLLMAIIAYFSTYIQPVINGETVFQSYAWVDTLTIDLSFYIDGLSLFFSLLVIFFGLLVMLYSFAYMKESEDRNRFFCYLLFFMGSMLGLVLSANLISLFVFWELTSLSSFLLIGFKNENRESRRSARQALLVTAAGGLFLMSGFIFLEIITANGFDLISTINSPELVADSPFKTITILLIVIGAMSKSAQFPLHFWLPNAMAAPTPVSAYLHSATMVKAGVYLILRLNPLFNTIPLWSILLGAIGAITMMWGAFRALQEDDLKKILAYTTISALGIFFMMTGLGGKEALNATLIYVLAHALYKGGLFLAAGNIDHQTGTRKLSELSGLLKQMPYTSLAIILCLASMAGVLPMLGFIGKESLYHSLYHSGDKSAIIYLILLFIAGAFFTAISIEVIAKALLKSGTTDTKAIKRPHFLMILSPMLLALSGLLTGLMPGWSLEPLLQWSAASTYAASPSMELKLWHGFNFILVLSIMTLAGGAMVYFILDRIKSLQKPNGLSGDFFYKKVMTGIKYIARYTTVRIQNGLLRDYISLVVITFSVVVMYTLLKANVFSSLQQYTLWEGMQIYEVVIFALILLAVVFLYTTKSRLIVTATFGIIGYSIALGYTLFSAPDVAITQFLAETLTLMLLIVILHKLPAYTLKKFITHKKYLPVAVVFGLIMSLISYVMLHLDKKENLKSFFLENSIAKGKGENAVNVILVDFRAFDTLGEITVLTITMIGIIALLRVKLKKQKV